MFLLQKTVPHLWEKTGYFERLKSQKKKKHPLDFLNSVLENSLSCTERSPQNVKHTFTPKVDYREIFIFLLF